MDTGICWKCTLTLKENTHWQNSVSSVFFYLRHSPDISEFCISPCNSAIQQFSWILLRQDYSSSLRNCGIFFFYSAGRGTAAAEYYIWKNCETVVFKLKIWSSGIRKNSIFVFELAELRLQRHFYQTTSLLLMAMKKNRAPAICLVVNIIVPLLFGPGTVFPELFIIQPSSAFAVFAPVAIISVKAISKLWAWTKEYM